MVSCEIGGMRSIDWLIFGGVFLLGAQTDFLRGADHWVSGSRIGNHELEGFTTDRHGQGGAYLTQMPRHDPLW